MNRIFSSKENERVSVDDRSCLRAALEGDIVRQVNVIWRRHDHRLALEMKNQSRQPEYDRPAALPRWARTEEIAR
jgi:hypothetical protein